MISSKIISVSAAMLMASSVVANACECLVPASTQGDAVGQIVSSGGDVLASSVKGLEPAKPGTELFAGSQIIVGNDSAANISVGTTCALSLQANSEATINADEDQLCVKVSEAFIVSEEQVFGQINTNNSPIIPIIVIGGIAGAFALFGDEGDGSGSN